MHPDSIARRTPGILKIFQAGQRCWVIDDLCGLPRGTEGTVTQCGGSWVMAWFRPDIPGPLVRVTNYEIDAIPDEPPHSKEITDVR